MQIRVQEPVCSGVGVSPPLFPLQVCKYIDIPLQHIANLTLLGMNRPPQAHTLQLLHKLRERIPGLALRTTFISGFPGGCHAPRRPRLAWHGPGRRERRALMPC